MKGSKTEPAKLISYAFYGDFSRIEIFDWYNLDMKILAGFHFDEPE